MTAARTEAAEVVGREQGESGDQRDLPGAENDSGRPRRAQAEAR
jgi:hypothetical protein